MYEVGKKYCIHPAFQYECIYHNKTVGVVFRNSNGAEYFYSAPLSYSWKEVKAKRKVKLWVRVSSNEAIESYALTDQPSAPLDLFALKEIEVEVEEGEGL